MAAIYELKLRLLADKVPALEPLSREQNLAKLEDAIINHFKEKITAEGVGLLKTGHQLRNKLMHSNFSMASEKLEIIKPGALKKGGVTQLKMSTGQLTTVHTFVPSIANYRFAFC